jgi:hypothetical protein
LRYLDAKRFYVIVPAAEVGRFIELSPEAFTVLSEDSLREGFDLAYVEAKMPIENRDRAGWYFQQLLKLLALQVLPTGDDELALLWDADTMPVRRLSFRSESGQLVYYRSDEHHRPYFRAIERLLGLQKIVNFSFISQSFPILGSWHREFISLVESRSGCHWIDAVLSAAELNKQSGFSEYETLGTFLSHFHPDEMAASVSHWIRRGFRAGLTPKTVYDDEALAGPCAFVAFEEWDMRAPFSGRL